MTTANLSLGLHTTPARLELAKFKAHMKAELGGFKFGIDVASLKDQVKGAFGSAQFLDASALTSKIKASVGEGFKGTYKVTIDTAHLTEQVKGAVKAGLAGATLPVSASAGVSHATSAIPASAAPELKALMAQVLTPAVDELARAATVVGSTARRIGAGGATSGSLQATSRYSYTDPQTGQRIAVAQRLGDAEAVMAQVKAKNAELVLEAKLIADAKLMHKVGNLEMREQLAAEDQWIKSLSATKAAAQAAEARRMSDIDKAWDQHNKTKAAAIDINKAWALADRDAATLAGTKVNLEQQHAEMLKAQIRQRLAAEAQANSQIGNYFAREAKLRAEIEATAKVQEASRRAAEAAAKARAAEQEVEIRQRMRNVQASAQFAARGQYDNAGVRVAGAKALVDQFGFEKAAAFLNNNAILGQIDHLDTYRKKMGEAGSATRQIAADMHTAHSAARGLASGFNAIWLTYGQVAPLLAGFAIATGVRAAVAEFVTLQYNLQFVKSLAGDATDTMAGLSKGLHDISLGLGVAPEDASKGLRALTQAGLDTKQAMQTLPQIFKLATVGELGVADAALSATGIMNAFGMSVNEVGRIGDVLAKAGALSATSVASMTESMKYASVIASQYGLHIEEVSVLLTALGKRNITGTAAGTATKNMLNEMFSPTSSEARKIMDSVLKVSAYDSSGNRKDTFAVLEEMRTALARFNSESQGLLMRKLFGEKGDKAFGAVMAMTSADLQKLLNEFKNAEGFTSKVFRDLQSTVQGQFGLLKSTVLNTLSEVGSEASGPLTNLMRTLREGFGSEGFKSAANGFIQSISTLGTVATYALPPILALWGTLKVSSLVFAGLSAAPATIASLTGALTRMAAVVGGVITGSVSLMSVISNVVPWLRIISVVGTLAAGIWMLTERKKMLVDKAADEIKSIDDTTAALRRENDERAKKLMMESRGLTRAQFDRDQQRSANQAMIQQLTDEVGGLGALGTLGGGTNNPAILKAQAKLTQLLAAQSRLDVEDRRAQMYSIAEGEAAADERRRLAGLGSALPKGTGVYKPTDGAAQAAAHAAESAEVRNAIRAQHDELARFNQAQQFRKELDDQVYRPDKMGSYLAALLTESRSVQATEELLAKQKAQRKELEDLKKLPNRNEADRNSLDGEIAHLDHSITLLVEKAKHEREIGMIKAANRREDESLAQKKITDDLDTQVKDYQDKIRLQGGKKITSKVEFAEEKARMEVGEKFNSALEAQSLKVLQAKERVAKIDAELPRLAGDAYDAELDRFGAAQAYLLTQQEILKSMELQKWAAQKTSGTIAAAAAREQETAAFGWEKFWTEYRETAESNSEIVYNVMKKGATSFQEMWASVLTTGKLNFRSFVTSVLAEVARAMAAKALGALLSFASGFFGGSTPTNQAGQALPDAGTSPSILPLDTAFSARGNVVTQFGAMPLNKFQAGGIARSPMYSIFAEAGKAEAYVPLQDGRSIPVTVTGAGSGGSPVISNVHVHLDSNGASRVESDASGEKAQQLGALVQSVVTQTLVKEQRPGGLLYAHG